MKKGTDDQLKNKPQRRWQRKLLFWCGIGFVLYVIIGFLIVPLAAKWLISDFIETDLDHPLKVGSVGFNPFTFALSVDDLYLYEPDSSDFILLKEVYVNPNIFPVMRGMIEFDTIAVKGAELRLVRYPDSTFNFPHLLGKLSTVIGDSLLKKGSWDLRINRLGVFNTQVKFEDQSCTPHFMYSVDSIHLQLNDLHLFSPDTAAWRMHLKMAAGGEAEACGILRIDEITSDFSFKCSGLALKPVQPLLSRFAHLRIDSGTLDASGDVHLQLDSLYNPSAMNFTGNVSNLNLSLHDLLKNESFLSWDSLTTTGITANINPLTATLSKITVMNFYSRIAIAEDRSINVVDVFQPLIQLIRSDPALLEMLSPEHFKLNIGQLAITRSGSDFSDLSLPLPFGTHVHSLNGNILNISADDLQGARLELTGNVDQYGYVAAKGTFSSFYPLAHTDIGVMFDNIDLASLTPYSAKFAGYALESGKISMDLSYKIRDGILQGSNQILLDHLVLGEEIESEEATGLPVKLAVALLKDPEGNIDLDVDVSGDLNDPRINMGQLVRKSFEKVILNIAASPFRFLGNLIGISNGEEMQYIHFFPGSRELPSHQQEKLINLGEVLKVRPEIKLEIHGAYDRVSDKQALQKARFDSLYVSRWRADSNVEPTEKLYHSEILERLYREIFSESELAELQITWKIRRQEGRTENDSLVIIQPDRQGYQNALQSRLIAAQPVSEIELNQLAQNRARTIRDQLIEMYGIPMPRIEIREQDVLDGPDGKWVDCRMEIDTL